MGARAVPANNQSDFGHVLCFIPVKLWIVSVVVTLFVATHMY